jgi:hypothetical protein
MLSNVSVVIPNNSSYLEPVVALCMDASYVEMVRSFDPSRKVTNGSLVQVPFDGEKWKAVAAAKPQHRTNGLYTNDPTQWAFHGHPRFAEEGAELHVALARLAGFRWPAETGTEVKLSDKSRDRMLLAAELPTDYNDGLLTLHSTRSSYSLADRLRKLLGTAFDAELSPASEQALVRAADSRLDKKEGRVSTLEDWLADRAFRQHCILFQHRPFLWQIWDGMKGGFSIFVNYHKLTRANLEKLTYTILGDTIRNAKDGNETARLERAELLQQNLAKIINGESPLDIFVRWKPVEKQPIGWEPDLDDGVRINIRPFVTAGVLREQPKEIHWKKDGGTNLSSAPWFELGPQYGGKKGDRINDHHTTLAEKRAARGLA